ncbi:hypothetical protein [Erwinia phage Snitter]|nr:hypothetical protein [Erwinia phage Snitter]
MTISLTTINFAKKRNVEVTVQDNGAEVWIWSCDNDCEPAIMLFASATGSFQYKGRVTASQDVVSEIPAHYKDEKALRMMIAFIAGQID